MLANDAIASVMGATAKGVCDSGLIRAVARRKHRGAFGVAMYHGLVDEVLDVDEWCFLDVVRFTRQMEYLAEHFRVVHVEDAARVAQQPGAPVAAVTFDDGFASVYDLAWPVLRRLRIPATVYVVTDLVDSPDTVWFGHLHEALSRTTLSEVDLLGVSYALEGARSRADASAAMQRALKSLPAEAFTHQLGRLVGALGVDMTPSSIDHLRMLTTVQITEMGDSGLIRFGGHTATHQILTRVSADLARREVSESVARIAEISGRVSTSFAYPNGGADDFDEAAVDELRHLGIDVAVTTISGPNWASTDMHRLNRYGIGSRDDMRSFAWRMHHGHSRVAGLRRAVRRGRGRASA